MRTRELEATLKTMTKDLEQATSRMNLFEKKLQDSRSELALLKGTPDVSRDTISLSFWDLVTHHHFIISSAAFLCLPE